MELLGLEAVKNWKSLLKGPTASATRYEILEITFF